MKFLLPVEGDIDRVVLGSFSASHLGDILCISPFPRLLRETRGLDVYVSTQPHMRDVFLRNPYVAGFAEDFTILPGAAAIGDGHVLQRLLQGFQLPLDIQPKPELYFDQEELAWAQRQRCLWPNDRPVCLLSTAAISDDWNLSGIDWPKVTASLSQTHTVIQPIRHEAEMPGAIIFRDLSVRQYMSLFTVADLFVGATSGGTHVAAALGVAAIVVIWRSLERCLSFPTSGHGFKASFLYPQHWFISAEDINKDHFDTSKFARLIATATVAGTKGRPTTLGNHLIGKLGFLPRVPPSIEFTQHGRFVRIPRVYSERNNTSLCCNDQSGYLKINDDADDQTGSQ